MKLNSVYNNLIQTALKDKSNIVEPKENLSKKKPSMYNIRKIYFVVNICMHVSNIQSYSTV